MAHNPNPWKFSTFILMFVLGLIVWMGFTQSGPAGKTVEAESFILRDSDGNVRGKIWMKGNQPNIQLYDRDGTTVWDATPNTADPGIVRRR
jgi:hypothetical protein